MRQSTRKLLSFRQILLTKLLTLHCLKLFRLSKNKEQYGVKSLSAAVGAPAAVSESPETVAKQIDEQMSKMQQMKRAPHTSSDYANEQKRLNELYNKKFRLEGKL